jgi:hypothetical protein
MGADIFDYRIATSGSAVSGSASLLGNLATPVDYPKSTFSPYAGEQQLISGLVRGVGYPNCTWTWSIITREQRDILRTFCPGKSANVYIRTKTMDLADSYHTYSAIMVWPTQQEERDFQRRVGLSISFKTLVLVS